MQLRLFQTMGEIATEQNSTIILPIPLDLLKPYLNRSAPDKFGASAVQKKSHEMETMRGDENTEGGAPNVIPNGETDPQATVPLQGS